MFLLKLLALLYLQSLPACLGRSRPPAQEIFSKTCAFQQDLKHCEISSRCLYTAPLPPGPLESGMPIGNGPLASRNFLRFGPTARHPCYIIPLMHTSLPFPPFQQNSFLPSSAQRRRSRGSLTSFFSGLAQKKRISLLFPSIFPSSSESSTASFATSRGGATTKNNRDSNPKYLGVKKYGGERVFPGGILVRQRGTRFKAGEGVIRGADDTLMAVTAGFVRMRRVQRNDRNNSLRIKGGHVVSVHPTPEETVDPKRAKVCLLRALAKSWMEQQP